MDATLVQPMQIVATITVTSILGLMLAFFSYFLDFCFWRGSIFDFYLPFVAKQITKFQFKTKFDRIEAMPSNVDKKEQYLDAVAGSKLFKVLGGCIICFNVWLGFISFPILHAVLPIGWWYMPVYILTASFFLRKITKTD